jgi:hypothetical protein
MATQCSKEERMATASEAGSVEEKDRDLSIALGESRP